MALPARVFWKLEKLAFHWGVAPSDIAGWATEGIIEIITSIGLVHCTDTEAQVGLVAVCAEDILPLFRGTRSDQQFCMIWRIRILGTVTWKIIAQPAQGLIIELDDLLVTTKMAHRFEEKYDPLQRVHVSPGRGSRHNWEGMLQALTIRLFEHGLPTSQADLVGEGQDWFVAHAKGGVVPDESQIRRKLSPIWRALKKLQ